MVGPPFHTRRKNNLGLSFPAVSDWPNFICEACTVRSVTKREITYKTDLTLLRLERMRLIDMSWYWAKGSYTTYGSKLRSIRDFEANFEVPILTGSVLSAPPCSPDIPLMWCIEANSTRLTTNKSHGAGISDHISFGTIRQLRSAAAQFWQWDALVSHPTASMLTREKRLLYQPCRSSDSLALQMFAAGLQIRMGDSVTPSRALLERHVKALDTHLNEVYKSTTCPLLRREAVLGGLANILLWLGWLRSGECFGLAWDDIESFHPSRYNEFELPKGVGFLSLLLAPETKGERTRRADILLAHQT